MVGSKLVNGYWFRLENGKTGLRLKTDNGKWYSIESPEDPYLFVRDIDLPKVENFVAVERGDYVSPAGEKCSKITFNTPSELERERDNIHGKGVPTFWGDIVFMDRVTIDKKLGYCENPKVLWFDIEVSSKLGFPKPRDPHGRILSIAALDNKSGEEFFFCDDSELNVISDFQELIRNYDIAVGFASNDFDVPYLRARCRRIGVPFNTKIIQWVDLEEVYSNFAGKERPGSLQSIAEKEAGFKIEKPFMRGAEIDRWFSEDRDALREYNLDDVRALKAINDAMNLIEIIVETSCIAHIQYSSSQYPMRVVDAFVFSTAQKRNPVVVFPTKGLTKKVEKPTGAYVMEPEPGFHGRTFEVDFQSMYSSIIRTWNIGPETIGGAIKTPKLSFRKEPRSIFAEFLEEVAKQREKYRTERDKASDPQKKRKFDIRQNVYKLIGNVSYGLFGSEYSRYFNKDLAESITLTGQELIKHSAALLKSRGYRVVRGDTDSVFCECDHLETDWLNDEIKKWVLETFNVPEEFYCLKIGLRNEYQNLYCGLEKKQYFGLLKDGTLNIVGYETERRNSPPIVTRIMMKIFDMIAKEGEMRKLDEFLADTKRELFAGNLDWELVIESGTKENLEDYTNVNAPQVKAMRKAMEMGYRPGEHIRYVITRADGGLEVEPVFDKLPKIDHSAREHYYYNRIVPVVKKILGYCPEEKTQRKLSDYL